MDLDEIFTYQKPDEQQTENIKMIRLAALDLARAIRDCTPSCDDSRYAIRCVRQAMMFANAAIVLHGMS